MSIEGWYFLDQTFLVDLHNEFVKHFTFCQVKSKHLLMVLALVVSDEFNLFVM
jgi:hypothetical protein